MDIESKLLMLTLIKVTVRAITLVGLKIICPCTKMHHPVIIQLPQSIRLTSHEQRATLSGTLKGHQITSL
jgi:hypothetical protein